jgi:hypothetical protein
MGRSESPRSPKSEYEGRPNDVRLPSWRMVDMPGMELHFAFGNFENTVTTLIHERIRNTSAR